MLELMLVQVADRLRAVMQENPRKSRGHLRKSHKPSDETTVTTGADDDIEIVYWTRGTPVGLLVAYLIMQPRGPWRPSKVYPCKDLPNIREPQALSLQQQQQQHSKQQ